MKKILSLFAFALALAATSCKVDNDNDFTYYYYTPEEVATLSTFLNLPSVPADYAVQLPNYLAFTNGSFARPTDNARVELGRVLFYDKNLSKDGTISCASCHDQALAFGDKEAVSKGVFGRTGERNSIALSAVPSFSGAYEDTGNSLFWDNRAATVQDQSRASLANSKEMDMNMHEVVAAVSAQPYYPVLFKKAFGDNFISDERVTEAIQNFVHSLASFKSKFDEAAEAEFMKNMQDFNFFQRDFEKLTAQENKGKLIYENNCASCHTSLFIAPKFSAASNGLDVAPTDPGVGGITNFSGDMGTFKVPALRNIALSAPYMHDGRFKTLEEVVEHYSSGVKSHDNLHFLLKDNNGQPRNLNLSNADKQALVAFLHTLTDNQIAADVRYANPFK